ncbi:MAG: hypothetical protein ACLQG5_13235 [Methanobacterium sp.]|jgi:hypothetical protein
MEKGKFYGKTINKKRIFRLKKDKKEVDWGMQYDYPTQESIKLIFKDYDELRDTVNKIMREGTDFKFKSSNFEVKEYYVILDWEDFLKLQDIIGFTLED